VTPETLSAIVAGGFAVIGIIVGAGLTYLGSYFEHRRRKADETDAVIETEHAILHGTFALTNFLNSRLNDWNISNDIVSLTPLSVAQPYVAKLIERSPANSYSLMVSLVGLGLSLEALLFVVGQHIGNDSGSEVFSLSLIEKNIEELVQAINTVELIVTSELPIMTDEELDSFPQLETNNITSRNIPNT
jgi:hypothetical protein